MIGTPKTLHEAIENGKAEAGEIAPNSSGAIEAHVLDFLRQKFGAAYLTLADNPQALAAGEALAIRIGVDRRMETRP